LGLPEQDVSEKLWKLITLFFYAKELITHYKSDGKMELAPVAMNCQWAPFLLESGCLSVALRKLLKSHSDFTLVHVAEQLL